MDALPIAAAAPYIGLEEAYGAKNYKPLDVVLARGQGVYVYDVEGRRYLDCLSAYSAVNQGHCHPKILAALIEQAGKLAITSRAFRNDQLGLFYEELCALTGAEKVLPMNSGAEAVETALKLARKWGYEIKGVAADRAEIIVAENNFHGRTIAIVGFSSDTGSRENFGPFAPGFVSVPFGDAEAIKNAITENTVAILIEPIQGEAGVMIPPEGYLRALRNICTEKNVLLMLDEIQTGMGRTGKLLAQEHEGVCADVTMIGKALSGGFYPVSAVLAKKDVMGVIKPGQHGSTFGGNPLASAVARAAMRVLVEEDMIANAERMGAYLLARLKEISSPLIKTVRGKGLMIAVELHPQAGGARRLAEMLMGRGILVKETHGHILRIMPPLIITKDQIDEALPQFAAVFSGGF